MSLSILFSVVIYAFVSGEIQDRLAGLQQTLEGDGYAYVLPSNSDFLSFRDAQASEAANHVLLGLIYANFLILAAGGAGSYLLAKRTLEPIEHAHDAQSRFVSDASHELRTPLTAMQTELEVALRSPELTREETQEILTSNLEEVTKLSSLTTALLRLSQADITDIRRERVDAGELIRGVVRRYKLPSSRLKLTAQKSPLTITADGVSIEELYTILIDNALKYSPAASRITMHMKRERHAIIFTITNEGHGINPDILPHIFDRFYRGIPSRNSTASGFGIGLSLAKKIVELHHGTLSVRSGTDQPTTFVVSLPRTMSRTPSKKS